MVLERDSPKQPVGEYRTDSVPADERYSQEGFFYDYPILTRTGIFEYRQKDGTIRRELRRPEDVFDPESLASYEGKPIIILHDANGIDKNNVRRKQVGTILTPGQRDGDAVRARLVLHDSDAVKDSGYRQLSLGYYQQLIEKPGEWEGQPYDAVQTNIRINHLSLVPVARAGEKARLNMDGKDMKGEDRMDPENKMPTEEIERPPAAESAAEEKERAELKKDADELAANTQTEPSAKQAEPQPKLDLEALADAIVAKISTRMEGAAIVGTDNPAGCHIQNMDADAHGQTAPVQKVPATAMAAQHPAKGGLEAKPDKDTLAEITARRDALPEGQQKADYNTLLAMLDKQTARADAAEAAKLNCDSADADITAAVNERVELIRMGERLNLDGMDTLPVLEAKKKFIASVVPNMRLDGCTGEYLAAAYDIAKAQATARKTIAQQRAQIFNMDAANAAQQKLFSPDEHRDEMIRRQKQKEE